MQVMRAPVAKTERTRAKSADAIAIDDLVARLRAAIPARGRTEKRMFGGVGFMLDGNMVAGTFRNALLVRVGKERNAEALRRPGARPMEMRGRPLDGYVMVDRSSLNGKALADWIGLARAYVQTLPAKSAKAKPAKPKQQKGARA
jgi:TfoX/Sxy family transcriptional regulator of competence genes